MADNRSILLTGRTGSGKSSTGNNITETKVFDVRSRVTTYFSPMESFPDNNQILTVIDTPGTFDFSSEPKPIAFKAGIHAVLVVLSLRSRFSVEDSLVIESLNRYFGAKLSDYMIVVFTHGDALEEEEMSLDDYLGPNCPDKLAKILEMCGNRFVVFDNVTEDKFEKYQQREELLRLLDEVIANNAGIPYTYDQYVEPKEFQWQMTELESSEVSENVSEFDKAYYEDQLQEMETILRETTQRLEEQLENEQVARMQAEEALTETKEEIITAREELTRTRAQIEAEKEERKTHRATKKLLKEKNKIEHQSKIEEKIREMSLKLENQVAEKFARMQVEEKAREKERKSNDEIRKLREDMDIVQRSILKMGDDHQIVAELRERNLKLEKQLQDEKAGRRQAEVKTQEVEKKANEEIIKLREDLDSKRDEGGLQKRIRDLEWMVTRMNTSDSMLRGRVLEMEKILGDEQFARRQDKAESDDEISKLRNALEIAKRDGETQKSRILMLKECLRTSQPNRTIY